MKIMYTSLSGFNQFHWNDDDRTKKSQKPENDPNLEVRTDNKRKKLYFKAACSATNFFTASCICTVQWERQLVTSVSSCGDSCRV